MEYSIREKALEVAVKDLFRWHEQEQDIEFPINTIRAYINLYSNAKEGITRQEAIKLMQDACTHFLDEQGFSTLKDYINQIP